MKKSISIALAIFVTAFILYLLKSGFCKFTESCGKTNYVEHIKTVVEPLKLKINNFYVTNERYPEWDEMALLLKLSGCQKLTFISKQAFINSPLTGKPMIDINDKSFLSYKYKCDIGDFESKIRASEMNVDTSEFTDTTRRQLYRKILGNVDLRFDMGKLSRCSLYFDKGESKMICGRKSWIGRNA